MSGHSGTVPSTAQSGNPILPAGRLAATNSEVRRNTVHQKVSAGLAGEPTTPLQEWRRRRGDKAMTDVQRQPFANPEPRFPIGYNGMAEPVDGFRRFESPLFENIRF